MYNKRTGLGLSLSYDIVTKQHGGELKVETLLADQAGKESEELPAEAAAQAGTILLFNYPYFNVLNRK